jgi:tol-pal system protein YbgF
MKRTHPKARAIAISAQDWSARQATLPWAMMAGFLFLALAAIALAPRAHAQVFSSTPYVAAPDPAVEQLRKRVEQLEADIRKAVDRAETLGAQLSDARRVAEEANNGRKKAEADLQALSERVQRLEDIATDNSTGAGAPRLAQAAEGSFNLTPNAPAPAPVDLASLPQDEEGFFSEAQGLLMNGNYPGAQEAFGAFLKKYPKASRASDAQYFIGESLLYQDNYPDAAAAYGKLIKDYPNASKGPDGLVKLARALRLMDKKADACKTLELMSKQFPKASATAKQLASTERQRAGCKA